MERLTQFKRPGTQSNEWRRLYCRSGKRKLKNWKYLNKLLNRKFNKKLWTPRSLKVWKHIQKVLKSVQKHQEVYLGGLRTLLYAADRKFKK